MHDLEAFFRATHLGQVVGSLCLFAFLLPTFLFIRSLIWKHLQTLTGHTRSDWDDRILAALTSPSKVLAVFLALALTVQLSSEFIRNSHTVQYSLKVGLLFLSAWSVQRFLESILKSQALPLKVTDSSRTLLLTILRLIILSVTILILLDNLGISITPILASLGVGSVAVALALQDTLSNFFSGLYILVDKPVRIGDFVRLESGTEGHIVKVGWRSTLIRMTSNNIVVIPNSKLASQRLTNYDLWEKETAVTFDVSVAYDNDLEKVEKITVEVGSQILATVEGGIGSFKPLVRFHTFNHSQLATLDFTVVLRARQITDQSLLKHEMIKALHRRFKQEGVVILTPGLQLLHTMNRSS